ncbi:uncharacterized protein LOC122005703 isoform X1 [Zingiber officinale]|uniref:Uncharacterized protein n=1 Tax=Zingiber officinale TaxID=94328 RepID=A0A8J5FHK2_ZINOF|nr:uncharacterized protein LOC122005703 isoform X1 [Zingiber officinale]KAG6489462.1 hypothetical protein ZIOFF_050731 [Zingiber officinale]
MATEVLDKASPRDGLLFSSIFLFRSYCSDGIRGSNRSWFMDILALCTRLRPAVLVDYGGIMPKLQENLSSLLLLAKKQSSTLHHLRVMILDDMVYIVNVEELAEHVFLSLSSGQKLILVDLEQWPLKILSPTEANDIASQLFSIQKLFSTVFRVGVDKESCIKEKHSAIQIADPIDLSSFLHDARITLPSLNGWLLGYPITYLFSKEYAEKATLHLSTKSLRIFKIMVSRQQASGSQLYETELMSFTVPCDMSQRLDKEPWIAAFLSRISEKLKRYKQIWASMQLEMEVTSDQLVVL